MGLCTSSDENSSPTTKSTSTTLVLQRPCMSVLVMPCTSVLCSPRTHNIITAWRVSRCIIRRKHDGQYHSEQVIYAFVIMSLKSHSGPFTLSVHCANGGRNVVQFSFSPRGDRHCPSLAVTIYVHLVSLSEVSWYDRAASVSGFGCPFFWGLHQQLID